MRNPQSAIVSIGTAVPRYKYDQETIADFMIRYFKIGDENARKVSLLYGRSGINFRNSVLPDFHLNGQSVLFDSTENNPPLSRRMNIYKHEAVNLAAAAVENCLSRLTKKGSNKLLPVTHLITVSCTGMSAPGLDIELMQRLKLPAEVQRTSVNFMGCYAGFHAFKMANNICAAVKNATVLVVMVELCSLHFQPGTDPQTIVVNSLFADGAAAVLFTSAKKAAKVKGRTLQVMGFSSEVIHEGSSYMTWNVDEKGFLMGLDAMVPDVIEQHAGRMVNDSLRKLKIKKKEIAHWVFHPGGRKILEATRKGIGLSEADLRHSYHVLRNYGNMSSPTICFALQELMYDHELTEKQHLFAAGFGPGITIETALLKPGVNG